MIGLIAWARFVVTIGGVETHITVPAPPTDPTKPWLADMLRSIAAQVANSFDVLQWPPLVKAQGGAGAGCDGYEPVDLRDWGSKNWQGGIPTRYGSLEAIMAAVSALQAHGVISYGDLVLHQQGGENVGPGLFTFLGADGRTMDGRGATAAGWFRGGTGNDNPIPPFSREDDVPVMSTDFPFGRERVYQNCDPAGATTADSIDAFEQQVKRTGVKGFRFDDVKGTYAPFVAELMNGSDLPFYSEYFDGNPGNLNGWATSSPMNGRSAVEDFTLHWRLQAACNGFDATQFDSDGGGYWNWNSGLAVGFVDNPDTDSTPGEQVVFNKGIAYAYMLCLPLRMALVYGKDYFSSEVWTGAYGLKPLIDNLCWISRTFAFGAFARRWVDKDVYAYTRDGNGGAAGWSGGLLVAINFNVLTPRTVTVQTTFGPDRQLHDYTGHEGDVWTDYEGKATITIGSNGYSKGESYVAYAPAGVSRPYPTSPIRTTHVFVGDRTRDVMPAMNGSAALPQRVHAAKGSPVTLDMTSVDKSGWTAASSIHLLLVNAAGVTVSTRTDLLDTESHFTGEVPATDWYAIQIVGFSLPALGSNFELAVTYLGAE